MKRKNLISPDINQGTHFNAGPTTTSSDDEHPNFCFKNIATCKDYGLKSASKEEKAQLLDAIYKRSSLTWNQIKLEPRTKLGFEQMKAEDLTGIPKSCPHKDKFMIFRVKNKTTSRMIGYRVRNTLHIVLYDKSGKSYKHD